MFYCCSFNSQKAFFKAVKEDNCTKVSELLKYGAKVNEPESPKGWSALHYAARNGSPSMTKLLLDAGADPNYFGSSQKQEGETSYEINPISVASMTAYSAENASDPALKFNDKEYEKLIKAPNAVNNCKQVIEMLNTAIQKTKK